MNTIQKGLEKAKRRETKRPKKVRGQKQKVGMIVHRPPIERKEVSRKLYDRMIQKSRASSVDTAFFFYLAAFVFCKRLLVNHQIY